MHTLRWADVLDTSAVLGFPLMSVKPGGLPVGIPHKKYLMALKEQRTSKIEILLDRLKGFSLLASQLFQGFHFNIPSAEVVWE